MKKRVVVTGFGPFGPFTHNPSSDIVNRLEEHGIPDFNGILITETMSVAYPEVDQTVHYIWSEYNPDLIVHIGVHPVAKTIRLEQQAFGRGYCRYDKNGGVPRNNTCPNVPSDLLVSLIDCDELVHKLRQTIDCKSLIIEKSEDPGRYLCGFSYYISLCHDNSKTLFVHVPEFDDEVTVDVVTETIQKLIVEILKTENE